jgi:hypothetical protein
LKRREVRRFGVGALVVDILAGGGTRLSWGSGAGPSVEASGAMAEDLLRLGGMVVSM